MERIKLNRIYQGQVSSVKTRPSGADIQPSEWPALSDWKKSVWKHHVLFQDAVNYYSGLLAFLADGASGWAGNFASQVREKWDGLKKNGIPRSGLREVFARALGISNKEADFEACKEKFLAGITDDPKLFHSAVEELFPEKKGRGSMQMASNAAWPMFCWKGFRGETLSEKRFRKTESTADFLFELFSTLPNQASKLEQRYSLENSALSSVRQNTSKITGHEIKERLLAALTVAESAAKEKRFQRMLHWQRVDIQSGFSELRRLIETSGESFSVEPWTGGNKDIRPIQFFILFKFSPSPFSLAMLKAFLRPQLRAAFKAQKVSSKTQRGIKDWLTARPSANESSASVKSDAIRALRAKRGYVFPAFTAMTSWGVNHGETAWKEFDMAAFEEALKSPHQIRQRNIERENKRKEKEDLINLLKGKGRLAKQSDTDEAEDIPGFEGDERIEIIKRILREDLAVENEATGGQRHEYGLHERTIRGFKELREKWNGKVLPGEKFSKDKHEKLLTILHEYQQEHRDDSGSITLFLALLNEKNWTVWQKPSEEEAEKHHRMNHAENPLRAYQWLQELEDDVERLKEPIKFTPAHASQSRRLYFFTDGAKLSSGGEFHHETNVHAFTTRLAVQENNRWQPKSVRISYNAPRLLRDNLRDGANENLSSESWVQPMLTALGFKKGAESQDFSACAVSLMPDWKSPLPSENQLPDVLLLNFPVKLEYVEIQKFLHHLRGQEKLFKLRTKKKGRTEIEEPEGTWTRQFNLHPDGDNFYNATLRWPHEKQPAKPPTPWFDLLDKFSCVSVDLGQRDAGAYAVLQASANAQKDFGKRPSRIVGETGEGAAKKSWRAALIASGMLRLSGEDRVEWRAPSKPELERGEAGFGWREELFGERGRSATPEETEQCAKLFSDFGIKEDDLLPVDWKETLSFPEQNDKLLRAASRAQWRVSRLHRWCWFLADEKKRGDALKEIRESFTAPAERNERWLPDNLKTFAEKDNDPRLANELAALLRDKLDKLPRLFESLANRVLPLRGRSWKWEKHPVATNENRVGLLTQNGAALPDVRLRGQRGLSLERIEQIEELRRRFQSLNQTLRRDIAGNPPIRRDEAVPDPCPDLLDKLDRTKKQRVNQTAHMILAEALGVRLAKPPANKAELRRERDQHGVYEKILDRNGNWRGVVDFIVIEDLKWYEMSQGRAPKENSRLMKWCRRQIREKLIELCEPFGLPVVEVNPADTSQFCSRSGAFGFRAVEITLGFHKQNPWKWDLQRLEKHRSGEKILEGDALELALAVERLKKQMDEAEKIPVKHGKPRTLFAPKKKGGPIFIPIVDYIAEANIQPAMAQADINAAINIGLRAIADPRLPDIHPRFRTQLEKDGALVVKEKRKFDSKLTKKILLAEPANENKVRRWQLFYTDVSKCVKWGHAKIEGENIHLVSEVAWRTMAKKEQWQRCLDINEKRIAAWQNKRDDVPM